MHGDYIKIDRSILEWEWYTDINTKVLFFHMLLKANWKDGNFRGTTVPRGSFVSSIRKLSEETGLTEREIRTGISHLKSTGEVTQKGHSKYSVFTVNNYCEYQKSNKVSNAELTGNQQATNSQVTTIEEDKKERSKETYSKRSKGKVRDNNNFERRNYDMDKLERQLMEGRIDE